MTPTPSERIMLGQLILKCAAASRPSDDWSADDYDVLADGEVVGRIMKVYAAPESTPRAYGHHKDRRLTHGYEPTREAAMAAFAKTLQRERGHHHIAAAKATDKRTGRCMRATG
jgi:hypothetical protein